MNIYSFSKVKLEKEQALKIVLSKTQYGSHSQTVMNKR